MNVFFDVDETILCSRDESLRPYVRVVFARVINDGHTIHIWSGVGRRWREIDQHGLRSFVEGCHLKPVQNHHSALEFLGVPVVPDFVVDDNAEIVAVFGGIQVKPYLRADPCDREMLRVYEAIVDQRRAGND